MNSFFARKLFVVKILLVVVNLLFVAKNMVGIIQLFASKLFVEKYHF